MSPGGRRPGKLTARDDIIRAARATFAAAGYDGTSLRAVARAAAVDAALVHHYFEGKPGLFIAAMVLPMEPGPVQADPGPQHPSSAAFGTSIVEAFLTMWDEAEGTGSSFVSVVGAMAASPAVADALRQFVLDCVGQHGPPVGDERGNGADARRALVASQLMGLALTRYLLRIPPISTASPREIAAWVGPTLESWRAEPLD